MVQRYSPHVNGRTTASVDPRAFVFSYTPSTHANSGTSTLTPEKDITPMWVDAMLCAMGAAMFLSNLVVLSQI